MGNEVAGVEEAAAGAAIGVGALELMLSGIKPHCSIDFLVGRLFLCLLLDS